jgi:hypothetical protein
MSAVTQGGTREEARDIIIAALRVMLAPDESDADADSNEPLSSSSCKAESGFRSVSGWSGLFPRSLY